MIRNNTHFFHPLVAFLATFSISLFVQFYYVFNSFLTFDDTIFVSRAALGHPSISSTHTVIFWGLEWSAPYFSAAALKITSIAFIGGIAAVCCRWLILLKVPPIASLVMGSGIALYPVAVDQGLFVTGSHPTIGSFFLLWSAYLVLISWTKPTRSALVGAATASVLAVVARLTSPSLLLGTIVPLVLTIGCWVAFRSPLRKNLLFLLVASSPILFSLAYGLSNYHYTALVGWTDYSAATILNNLLQGMRRVGAPLISLPQSVVSIVGLAFATIVLIFIRCGRFERTNLIVGVSLLVCAALMFGPSAIITSYIDRYAVPPFIFVALAIGTVLGPSLSALTPATRAAALVAGFVIFGAATASGTMRRAKIFDYRALAYERVSALTSVAANEWPANAQIVIALEPPLVSPTIGFNHWSTWYLRYLTGRTDIIALIGSVKSLNPAPFIERYKDHDPVYWEVKNGRSRRVRMRGIERARPLFAYFFHADERPADYCPMSVVFQGSATKVVRPGVAPDNRPDVVPDYKPDNHEAIYAKCVSQPNSALVWKID